MVCESPDVSGLSHRNSAGWGAFMDQGDPDGSKDSAGFLGYVLRLEGRQDQGSGAEDRG